ncbi:hypothetical protein HXX76_013796 [Chlamydomonas incerta]|uniref:Uncharacterized protein n=1 Tax=Chlamydomonas incerta TaxID=51695 RepID=A0A835VQE4_CHLIN|nr:hypothetical protein HXX76_013796 [Chlamydomonas incerta]|eukprot:KAG2425382.1 hypothetical protein HXX76_013796 [Chlamydomonas incerta]
MRVCHACLAVLLWESIFGEVEEDDAGAGSADDPEAEAAATAAIEPKHLLAALLQRREHCPGLHAALKAAGVDVGAVVDYLTGRAPPPQRSVPLLAGGASPAGLAAGGTAGAGGGSAGPEAGGGDDEILGAASVSAWRGLDSAMEGLEQRTADLAACGLAATAAAQRVLLQAYRWALRTGAPAVRPAHVAAALLTDGCLHRFRSGFATHPPAQAALELYAVLPGAACHRALLAVQAEMAAAATGEDGGRSQTAPAAAIAPAAPATSATAAAVAAAAVELLHGYSRSGLLPSLAALEAIAGSLAQAAGSEAAGNTAGVGAIGAAGRASADSSNPFPPAVQVLCTCSALGYRLPAAALPALLLLPDPAAQDGGSSSDGGDVATAASWITPRSLNEWLTALAAHGIAPAPRSLRAQDRDSASTAARSRGTTTGISTGGGSGSVAAQQPTQHCWPWLEDRVMCALAAASAWELAALAARLAALATVEPSWTRCAARATELAARCCLAVTPLWNGNRIYADLINIGDALLDMGQLAAAAKTAAEGGSSGGNDGGEETAGDGDSWVAVWTAVELPQAAARWRHKLAARLHKSGYGGEEAVATAATAGGASSSSSGSSSGRGPGGLLRRPLPREPEFPSFEQAGLLLGQAVDLAAAVGRLDLGAGAAGEPSPNAQGSGGLQQGQQHEQHRLLLPVGLVLNLLAVLQLQLRTCAAGPCQLEQVAAALRRCSSSAAEAGSGEVSGSGSGSGCGLPAAESVALRTVLHSRHVAWVAAALSAYGLDADSDCGSGSSISSNHSSADDAGSSAAAAGLVRLLPSLVLGQAYRSWAPDLTPPVAAALHDACSRQAASRRRAPSNHELDHPEGGDADVEGAWGRCLARLHYPLPLPLPLPGSTEGAAATTAPEGPDRDQPGAPAAPAAPTRAPYTAERLGIRTLAMAGGGGGGGAPRPGSSGSGAARYHVARPYPPTGNLPTLPPLAHTQLQQVQRHLHRWQDGRSSSDLDGGATLLARPTQGDDGCVSSVGAASCGGLTPGMLVALTHAVLDASETDSGDASTPHKAAAGTSQSITVVPPGSRPRRLRLPDADVAALAAALTRAVWPGWLRADEMWLLHVADRDAGLRQRLQAAGEGSAAGGSGADDVGGRWAQWMAAAGDVQLARVVPAAAQLGLTGRPASAPARAVLRDSPASASAALPLVLIPAHTPPSAVRPVLPPVCRLELLLARQQAEPVQTLLALMWQGDWYRGDAASLARFSAAELLYVLCALVALKEAEELEERPLGWMAGDGAADTVLDMLACPTHAHLLAHPGVAWGVGTHSAAAAGAAAATAGAYVPSDLAAEKRVRGQKLLDAAADVDEYASRVMQALQFLAATGGMASGVLGGGRLDPYRPLAAQGDALAGFEAHAWLHDGSSSSSHGSSGSSSGDGGMKLTDAGGAEVAPVEGVSIRGLRARRPEGKDAVARKWESVLGGPQGVASLRWALRAWGQDPDRWMAMSR